MKLHLSRPILLCLFFAIASSYSNPFISDWIFTAGGKMSDDPQKIAVDADGNVYVAGYFNDTAFFEDTVLRATDVVTMFILKLGPDGKKVWVKQGRSRAGYCDIAVD